MKKAAHAESAFLPLQRAASVPGKQGKRLPFDLINTAEILNTVFELWPQSLV